MSSGQVCWTAFSSRASTARPRRPRSLGRSPGPGIVAPPRSAGCQPPSLRRSWGSAFPLAGCQLITLTTHRLYQFEPELRAKPPYADVDHVRAGVEFEPPDRGQQLALGDGPAWMLHQLPEQQELQPSEGHGAVADVGLQPSHVQHQVTRPEHLAGLMTIGAQPGPDSRQQFGEGE